MTDRLAYRVDEAAAALGVSETAVRNAIARGDLFAKRFGRTLLIPRGELEKAAGEDPTVHRVDVRDVVAELARAAGLEVTERQVAS